MRTDKNIALIGFMGAGKSSVAKKLAGFLHRKLFSTDKLIEAGEGKTVARIFKESGEAYFRKLERATIRDLHGLKNAIIDCGGGIILNPQNIKDLRKNSVIIHLSVSPRVVYQRIKNQKTRPLLKVPHPQKRIQELISERLSLYAEADHRVDVNRKTIDNICQEIISLVFPE